MNRTQTRFSRLGIFGNIQIQPIPTDTSAANPTLDVYNFVQFEDPMEASIEVNATSKSNSYLGPGLILGLSNNNIFGGGSVLACSSMPTMNGRRAATGSVFNSYEFGVTPHQISEASRPQACKAKQQVISTEPHLTLGPASQSTAFFSCLLNSTPASHMSGRGGRHSVNSTHHSNLLITNS